MRQCKSARVGQSRLASAFSFTKAANASEDCNATDSSLNRGVEATIAGPRIWINCGMPALFH
jgi:hypothetical protein